MELEAASLLSRPADEFGNDPQLERMWAIKAYEHCEVYFNLLCSLDPKLLKLTPHDQLIYDAFRKEFPDLEIHLLDAENLKADDQKEKWRPFCNQFEASVEDFNFATLLRVDCAKDYSEDNTVLVPRIQFYAIEVARNKEGLNDGIRQAFKPTKRHQN